MKTGQKLAGLTALTVLGLAGCVTDRTPGFEKSPLFPQGYSDGCNSAVESEKNFSSALVQDEALFKDDPGYRSGWRQGYASCRQRGETGTGDGIFRGEQDPAY